MQRRYARESASGQHPSELPAQRAGAGRRQASAPALLLKPKSHADVHGTALHQPPPSLLRRAHSLDSRPARDVPGALVVSAARTLQRAVSGYLGLAAPVPTTLCHICFENVATADTVQLTACRHRFCAPCLKQYLKIKIKDGNVFPVCFHPVEVPSPSSPSPTENDAEQANATATTSTTTTTSKTATTACGKRIQDAQLQTLVGREVWAKCTLFRFNKANATARECPFCAHPQQCAGPAQPACTCTECGRVFCFFHGNAHVDGSCADFELQHRESETQSRMTIARVTKPCPGCQSHVEKSGGCNHMTCVVCHAEFCWLCNEKLEPGTVSDHFSAMNLTGCGGRQFDNVGPDGRESLWARFCRLYGALHLQYVRRLYQAALVLAYLPAYLPAGVLWLLIVGVTRVRPIRAISNTPFSNIVALARVGTAGIVAFAAFYYTFRVLPDRVLTVYMYLHQVKAFGELGVIMWPSVVSRSRNAWQWVGVRARHVLGGRRPRRLSDPPAQDPEREALFA